LTLLALAPVCALFSAPAGAGCAHPAGAMATHLSDYRLDSLRMFEIGAPIPTSAIQPIGTPWSSPSGGPCSGPNCKRNSTPSQAPSPFPLLLRIDGCLAGSRLDPAPRDGTAFRFVEPPVSRIHAGNALERPPRPSAS